MKKSKRILSLFLALIMLCCTPMSVNAMSAKNIEAHKALKKQVLADKEKYHPNTWYPDTMRYAFADIDGDHVDELITVPGYGYLSQIAYDYKNGKVRKVATVSQGSFTRYYPKRKVIFVKNSGHMGYLTDYYYKMKGNSYKLVASEAKSYGNRSYDEKPEKVTYYVNGKQTTRKAYRAYVKTLTQNTTVKKFSSLKWKVCR